MSAPLFMVARRAGPGDRALILQRRVGTL